MRGLPVLRWCSQHPWHDGPVPEGGLLAVLMTGIAAAPSVLQKFARQIGKEAGIPVETFNAGDD